MGRYQYRGVGRDGREVSGQVEADSEDAALAAIRAAGCFPTELGVARPAGDRWVPDWRTVGRRLGRVLSGRGASAYQVRVVTRQLAALLRSGIPLVRSLTILRDQSPGGGLHAMLAQLAREVESGRSLSDALSAFPGAFSGLYLQTVRAGEAAGALDMVLDRLARFLETHQRLRARIVSALVYPLFVLFVALIILGVLTVVVVPQLTRIFEGAGVALPVATQILIRVSGWFYQGWHLLVPGLVGAGVLGRLAVLRVPALRAVSDAVVLRLPLIGSLVRQIVVARFARTFGTLTASGVPILQALSITRDACGNAVFARAVHRTRTSIREGESVSGPLKASGVFPLVAVNMIAIGEESGTLAQMLELVAEFYEEETEIIIGRLTALMEPMLIVLMGLGVAAIVIPMFLPLVSLFSALGGE